MANTEASQGAETRVPSPADAALGPAAKKALKSLVECLAQRAAFDDVETFQGDTLEPAAKSFFSLLHQRAPGTSTIRAFNPSAETDGWECAYTIIEIVNDDMPFLVDSVLGELNDMELGISGILHPVVFVKRGEDGQLTDLLGVSQSEKVHAGKAKLKEGFAGESIMHIEVDRQVDAEILMWIRQRLDQVLSDVRVVTSDWRDMRERLGTAIAELEKRPPSDANKTELAEVAQFLEWLKDDHFAFLGARDYEFVGDLDDGELKAISGSGLGLLRDLSTHVVRRGSGPLAMSPMLRAFLESANPIIVTKANSRSRVHRRVYMDYVGVKTYGKGGKVTGERRFVGLFTAAAYNSNTHRIPMLAEKVDRVVARANITADGHDRAALLNILETYPRDELFQISEDELLEMAIGILRLQKRPRTKVFLRFDPFDRFVSAIVYVPRDRYSTELRARLADILVQAFDGRPSAFYPNFADGPLARVHFIIGRNTGPRPDVDIAELEARITAATRDWSDDLRAVLGARWGDKEGRLLGKRYLQAFPVGYRERFTAEDAADDITRIEALPPSPEVGLYAYRDEGDPDYAVRLHLYHWDAPITLSDVLPVLEHMGLRILDESPYELQFSGSAGPTASGEECAGRKLLVHAFSAEHQSRQPIELDYVGANFEEAFRAIWAGNAENDGFNRLVVEQGLPWRDVLILRVIAKFWRQTGSALSQPLMERTFSNYGEIARDLVSLFETRLRPADLLYEMRQKQEEEISSRITAALDEVESLDADRIIRRFRNVIRSILRTNFYQQTDDGADKTYISIKIDSRRVQEIPEPKPWVEVFLYSPRVEGVHLRFGKVARGGLRWSDREEDFRTEVLGLVKAQQVKNSLIVPVGAKGGFVPKFLPEGGSREEIQAEAIACYKTFISGLLDITDNIESGAVIFPDDVVRHDGDDPYLVVAADKGTATFSDIANDMAGKYGFWLGDAFASGGSQGYDHKKMGITARGAWEAVKRHFRERGTDIQTEPFTAVGVGDMSGDVFGNGMLLSPVTRLVAAFDHRDIFVDPTPDEAAAFAERQRLFEMPRSSWQDYDTKQISKGGGIFSRSRKSIPLTDEIRRALGTDATQLSPQELIQVILKAPVDLLWFGGIGTYIKSKTETNFNVGDRSNDAVRIDGREVRAKVVGEGANLGCTQRGRIEYSRAGGRINTDFIDNVSGVDTSDHEVNIKILLDSVVASGALSVKERNASLADMTGEVAELVLRNNYRQSLALSMAEETARGDLDSHSRFMRILERHGQLDRGVEYLPDEEVIRELKDAGLGLSRPEIATLIAYSKNTLFEELLTSNFPDDDYLEKDLFNYFPAHLPESYPEALRQHQLRREIVTTLAANQIVNMGGLTFLNRIKEHTGSATADSARAFVAARDVFDLAGLRRRINDLDLIVETKTQISMQLDLANFLRRQVLWFVRYYPEGSKVGELVDLYRPPIIEIGGRIEDMISEFEADYLRSRIQARVDEGVNVDLARDVCALDPLSSACDIADIARAIEWPVDEAARAYSEMGALVGLPQLRAAAAQLSAGEHFERLSVKRMIEDLFRQQRFLTLAALQQAVAKGRTGLSGADAVDIWAQSHAGSVDRATALVQEMESHGAMTAAKLALAASQVRDLALGVSGFHPGSSGE